MIVFYQYQSILIHCTLQGCNIPDIDIVVQWKLPKTFSNWVQRAGRAARGKGRSGLAVLLVEPSAYSRAATANKHTDGKIKPGKQEVKGKAKGKMKTQKVAGGKKTIKEYAQSHGVKRGGFEKLDEPPCGEHPPFDPDAIDEGLLRFVQATKCRRTVWADTFETVGMRDGASTNFVACNPEYLNPLLVY